MKLQLKLPQLLKTTVSVIHVEAMDDVLAKLGDTAVPVPNHGPEVDVINKYHVLVLLVNILVDV